MECKVCLIMALLFSMSVLTIAEQYFQGKDAEYLSEKGK